MNGRLSSVNSLFGVTHDEQFQYTVVGRVGTVEHSSL